MNSIVAVSDLRKRFNLEAGFFSRFGRFVYAVNGVSFTIGENESFGLVGESGCGKTTTARLLVRMYESDGGKISYRGADIKNFGRAELSRYRAKVKYVFQDPARSLDPRMSVYDVLVSGLRCSALWPGKKQAREKAAAILEEAGLAAGDLERRPAEFSGGQRQRISIARGLIMEPELLVCDEVVSALDVSIQGQILNLLLDLRGRRKLSFLFIAHDLKVASWFCDRIAVMYKGEIMESAPAAGLYKNARHPYTRLLFSAAPNALQADAPRAGAFTAFKGEVRTALAASSGCAFAERCPFAESRCLAGKPELSGDGGHLVRCFL
ncbi:MAG: ABC transporter ATP-binding protein [Treponema sp.]|jgi:oligopeptide/dipeptide ABC transporter ATP-binding protein|nr:ABC transporter ATP-binding protein [Treponema sp.]